MTFKKGSTTDAQSVESKPTEQSKEESHEGTTPAETGSIEDSMDGEEKLEEEDEDEIEMIRSDIRDMKKQIKDLQKYGGRGGQKPREMSTDSADSKASHGSKIKLLENSQDSGNLADMLGSRQGSYSNTPEKMKKKKRIDSNDATPVDLKTDKTFTDL